MRRNICALVIFVLTFALFANGQNSVFKEEDFKNPPLNYYPRPFWFWNNTEVKAGELLSQMQSFHDSCNYGGFGILGFGRNFKPDYLSNDYFELYGKALKKASELNLTMCLYDEYGFPSGGAGAHNADNFGRFEKQLPDQTIKRLDKTELEITGPSVCIQKVPEGKLMAIVAMENKSLKRISLSDHVVNGELKWEVPEGNWKLMFFTCVKDGDPIVDYLDPESVRSFIRMTHEAYFSRFKEYFGNVISGTFFDEPTMYRAKGRTWTISFNEKFKQKFGFDPDLFYPALWYDIGPETHAARNYLFGFRSELYTEGFTKEVNDWSVAHHITATGHQDQEEVLNPVSVSGDLMKCFKYLEIPGIDKIGGDRPAERFYKVVSSAAYNWNSSLVMSETYGAMGNISWKEIFAVAMDQYAKGINVLIPHAVWYDDTNVRFKPELSHRNPLYADSLKIFNQFLARLNLLLQQPGRQVADIAVLYPIHNLQAGHFLDGPLGFYKGGVEIPKTDYIDVANWLTEDAGKDFTFIHPEVLDDKCRVGKGKLQLQNPETSGEFRVIIIPSCKTISLSNLKKIKEFHEKGGNLIFTTQLPQFATEFGKDNEVTQIIRSIFPAEEQSGSNLAAKFGKAIFISNPNGQSLREALEDLKISFDVEYSVSRELRYIHKVVAGRDVYYFANLGKTAVDLPIKFRVIQNFEVWDPHTGSVFIPENQGDSKTRLPLQLAPLHSVFWISEHK